MADDADVVIRSILQARTHYDALGITRTVTAEEVARAYKRRAIKCHPDRCQHAKAVEAMQRLTQAKDVLTDPVRRRDYDNYGDNPQPAFRPGPARRRHPGQPVDVFDVFEQMFFGGAGFGQPMPQHMYRRPQPQPHVNVHHVSFDPLACLQSTFFIFFLLAVSFITMWLPNLLSPTADFSLSPDTYNGFTVPMTTRKGDVMYYVPRTFAKESRGRVERDVLRTAAATLQRSCRAERAHQQQLLREAQMAWSTYTREAKKREVWVSLWRCWRAA